MTETIIMQLMLHGSLWTVVFWCKNVDESPLGLPQTGEPGTSGVKNIGNFRPVSSYILKRYKIGM